jgi:hypothetical protein
VLQAALKRRAPHLPSSPSSAARAWRAQRELGRRRIITAKSALPRAGEARSNTRANLRFNIIRYDKDQ